VFCGFWGFSVLMFYVILVWGLLFLGFVLRIGVFALDYGALYSRIWCVGFVVFGCIMPLVFWCLIATVVLFCLGVGVVFGGLWCRFGCFCLLWMGT